MYQVLEIDGSCYSSTKLIDMVKSFILVEEIVLLESSRPVFCGLSLRKVSRVI